MESESEPTSFGQVQSIFDRAWDHMLSTSSDRDIALLLQAIETQLQLPRGFLTLDAIILQKISTLPMAEVQSCSKEEFLLFLMHVLSEIKVLDLLQKTVYGDFGDNHRVYEDNHNNYLYRNALSSQEIVLQESPAYSLILSGSPLPFESDTDTSSLMDATHFDPASSIWSGDDFDTFNLQRILEDLNNHHFSINLSFQTIGSKLEKLKSQNSRDLEFLNRLCANNDVIREKMHDMRNEISHLLSSVEKLKSRGRDLAPSKSQASIGEAQSTIKRNETLPTQREDKRLLEKPNTSGVCAYKTTNTEEVMGQQPEATAAGENNLHLTPHLHDQKRKKASNAYLVTISIAFLLMACVVHVWLRRSH